MASIKKEIKKVVMMEKYTKGIYDLKKEFKNLKQAIRKRKCSDQEVLNITDIALRAAILFETKYNRLAIHTWKTIDRIREMEKLNV